MAKNQARITYLIRQAIGGMQNHLIYLATSLKNEFEISVISPKNSRLEQRLSKLDIPVHTIEISNNLSPVNDWLAGRKIKQVLKQAPPDILHIHSSKAALVAKIGSCFSIAPKTIITVHNYLTYQQSSWPISQLALWLDRKINMQASFVVCVSRDLKDSLTKLEKLPNSQAIVIHNGQPLDELLRIGSKERGNGEKKLIKILTVGRLVAFKGHEYLFKAVKLLKNRNDLKFYLAGDGPLKKKLIELHKQLKLNNRLEMLGFIDNIKPWYAQADLFVLPSIREPFGIVLLEAMAAGLPVIATRAGGAKEIIQDGKSGVLVPPADPSALAEAICKLADDREARLRLAAAGKERVKKNFSLRRMIDETRNLYYRCLENV